MFGAVFSWAPSSEFVISSIPSWQTLTAHVQPFRGARDLAFCLKVPLDSLLVWASSEGSGETARMRRLAWTFAARIGDKYQIRLARPSWSCSIPRPSHTMGMLWLLYHYQLFGGSATDGPRELSHCSFVWVGNFTRYFKSYSLFILKCFSCFDSVLSYCNYRVCKVLFNLYICEVCLIGTLL